MNIFKPAPDFNRIAVNDVMSGLVQVGERIADRAGQIVPVRTGFYREHLDVIREDGFVVVASHDPGGVVIESGSSTQAPMAPLRRAASEIAKFESNPKPGTPRRR